MQRSMHMEGRGQLAGGIFSLSTMWNPEIEFRASVLVFPMPFPTHLRKPGHKWVINLTMLLEAILGMNSDNLPES